MAPAFKSVTAANYGSGTSHAITLPNTGDGAAVGDMTVLVAAITPGTITDPSGWAVLSGTPTTPSASGGRFYVWTKTYVSGDLGATLTLTASGSSRTALVCATFDPSTVDVSGKDETNTGGSSAVAPSVSPTTTSGLLVCLFGVISNTSGDQPTWTAPGSMTERADVTSVSTTLRNATILLATEALTVAGSTGTRTGTPSLNVQRQAISLVLAGTASTAPLPIISPYNSYH